MPTLVLFLITVVAWLGLELAYILTGRATISEQVRTVYRVYPPLGVLMTGIVMAILAHFFWS